MIRVFGVLPWLAVVPALAAMTGEVSAQQGSTQQAAAAEPDQPVLTLSTDAALITGLIKPDRTADFESFLGTVKKALAKSERPERRKQAAGWTVFKGADLVDGSVAYVMQIDPVVKGRNTT